LISAFANSQPNGPLHPQAVNTSLTNDPHLEKVGNNYKKVDPFTLAHQARPSQPLGKRRSPRTCWDRYTAKSSYLGMLQPKPDIYFPNAIGQNISHCCDPHKINIRYKTY
jgi:hypothetical protein